MTTCVYTVLLGSYDALLPQPVAADSDSEFICFTDDPEMSSDTWRTVLVEPRFPQDLHRSSRVYKILGHEVLDDFDATLCIDASVRLRVTPEKIIEAWLTDGVDMALAKHSYREQVLDEFDEVVRLNYDDRSRVYEQLVDYSIAYPDVLEAHPHWGGMLVRRRTPAVAAAMRLWFDHVLRYSRRDQLSLMVALQHGGLEYASIELDNFDSDVHEWPVITQRRVAQGKAAALPSGPLLSELRRARRRVHELEADLALLEGRTVGELLAESQQRHHEGVRLRAQIEELCSRVAQQDRQLGEADSILGALRNLDRAVARRFKRKE